MAFVELDCIREQLADLLCMCGNEYANETQCFDTCNTRDDYENAGRTAAMSEWCYLMSARLRDDVKITPNEVYAICRHIESMPVIAFAEINEPRGMEEYHVQVALGVTERARILARDATRNAATRGTDDNPNP